MALGLLFVPFLPFTVSFSMIILPKSSAKIIVFSELEKYLLLKFQFLFGLPDAPVSLPLVRHRPSPFLLPFKGRNKVERKWKVKRISIAIKGHRRHIKPFVIWGRFYALFLKLVKHCEIFGIFGRKNCEIFGKGSHCTLF